MSLVLDSVHKHYGPVRAVDGVSLELAPGETLALLGPSGCGKSTLLRLIAGLEPPDGGCITLDGHDLSRVPAERRGFGLVFQDYALFPHLNVAQNIAFGLVEQGWERSRRDARVAELLHQVGLAGYERRRVQQLSGGEQQRVALARALAPNPRLLLFDEPLSNLDPTLRDDLKEQLRRLLTQLSTSAIYVTHDQSEAFAIAERIALMRAGRLVQVAPAATLYQRPTNLWAARFLGHENIYPHNALSELFVRTGMSQDSAPYMLLRSDLVRLGQGDFLAEVRGQRQLGQELRLELLLLPYHLPLQWRGFAREVPHPLALGDRLTLDIPRAAWIGLADA
jgi:ABC-type Fe3+/spermidine/putrescine transport system ATPase subunit